MKIKKIFAIVLSLAVVMTTIQPMDVNGNEQNGEINALLRKLRADKKENSQGEVIVIYRNNSMSLMSMNGFIQDNDVEELTELDNNTVVATVNSTVYSTDTLMNTLGQDPNIISVEPNTTLHLMDFDEEAYSDYQWYLSNIDDGQDVMSSYASANPSSVKDTIVAVLDSGVDYSQKEIADNLWVNGSSNLNGTYGYDFANDDDDPMDDVGHGNHVTGIIASNASDNKGISGIVGNGHVKIMSLKIFGQDGSAQLSDAIKAYNYIYEAQQEGYNIVAINNSWGNEERSVGLEKVIELVGQNGALSVCASGNSATDNDVTPTYPASCDSKYIISVAASTEKDTLASFSNYGTKSVDICAPGTNILSNYISNVFTPNIYQDKDKYCQYYENFDNTILVDLKQYMNPTPDITNKEEQLTSMISYLDYTLLGDGIPDVSISNEEYFEENNNQSEGSFSYSITGCGDTDFYYLSIPYTVRESGTPVYLSLMLKAEAEYSGGVDSSNSIYLVLDAASDVSFTDIVESIYGSDIDAEYNILAAGEFDNIEKDIWTQSSKKIADGMQEETNRMLYVLVITSRPGNHKIYLDNWGVSSPDVSEDDFGKYTYQSGTSMATPMVTSAVALTASSFSKETCLNWKTRILESARKVESLDGFVSTGGILNLNDIHKVIIKADDSTEKETTAEETRENKTTVIPTTKAPVTQATMKNPIADAKVKIAKVAVKKKASQKIKVTLSKKIYGATGYSVRVYQSNKNAKLNKNALIKYITKKNIKTITVAGKKLANKKSLYVRVRAYKTVKGKKLYSNKWSNIVKVKIKK